MKAAFLPDRGVVKVSGEAARDFLNGLVTTDVTLLRPGLGGFGALLTPQGKIVVDFLITEAPAGHGGGFLIDCPRALAQALAGKLGFYKLRAKVGIENLSDSLGVLAAWDGDFAVKPDLAFADPRNAALGCSAAFSVPRLAPSIAKHSTREMTVGILDFEMTSLSAALVAISNSSFLAWAAESASGLVPRICAIEPSAEVTSCRAAIGIAQSWSM